MVLKRGHWKVDQKYLESFENIGTLIQFKRNILGMRF
jgi:hypothetical protein